MNPELMTALADFRAVIASLIFRWIAKRIAPYTPPRRPRRLTATLIREEEDNMLIYNVPFPPPGAPDVKTRKLTVIVDGVSSDHEYAADETDHEFRVPQGSAVVVSLVDIDDAGNASLPSDPFSFTAADTLAPSQPGQLAVELVAEEPDANPAEAPPDGGNVPS